MSPPAAKFAAKVITWPTPVERGSRYTIEFLYSGLSRSAHDCGGFLTSLVLTTNATVSVWIVNHLPSPSRNTGGSLSKFTGLNGATRFLVAASTADAAK